MKRIIFATTNQGKINEIKKILEQYEVDIVTMRDAGIDVEIEENGKTFLENAVIKAKTVMEITGEIVMSDDSGLEVDYIGGEPGIYSARYLGRETPYELKNKNIIERLKDAEGSERSARFVCAMAAAFPNGEIITCRETMEGFIAYEPKGTNGFGYDPIVYLPEFGMTSGELEPDVKNQVSHRGKALRRMQELLKGKLQ